MTGLLLRILIVARHVPRSYHVDISWGFLLGPTMGAKMFLQDLNPAKHFLLC